MKDNEKKNRPDISAIIVNYKTPDYTNQAVESIVENSSGVSKEILVVDNASGEDCVSAIREKSRGEITLLENTENAGFAKANNLAMKMASGRYFLLLNSDAEVTEGCIEKLVRYADEHSEVGILGCKVISKSGEQQSSCWRVYNLQYLISRAFNLYRFFPDGFWGITNFEQYGKPIETVDVEVVSGCVMLVRREAADKVGFFDERFFMYCEDMDWCARMRQGGFAVRYFSDAEVIHYGRGSCLDVDQMRIDLSRSILRFMSKNYGVLVGYLANIFLGLFFLLRLPAGLIKKDKVTSNKKFNSYLRSFIWHVGWPLISR